MSKVLTSPVSEYQGTVTIPSRLTAPQYQLYKKVSKEIAASDRENLDELAMAALPGVLGLVEDWAITGIESPSLETFPVTPIVPCIQFLLFVWGEINQVVLPTVEAPNA